MYPLLFVRLFKLLIIIDFIIDGLRLFLICGYIEKTTSKIH